MNKKNNNLSLLGINQIDTAGLRTPILIIIGIGTVVGVGYYIKQKSVYNRRKKAEDNAIEYGTTANFAKRLQIAMGGSFDGTDEKAIFQVFSEFRSKDEFELTQREYNRLTGGRILSEDLSRELSVKDYTKLMEIISQKKQNRNSSEDNVPDSSKEFAQRLRQAIQYWDVLKFTDIDEIYSVFETIPNVSIYEKTKQEYKNLYGTELWVDLEGEVDLTTYKWFANLFSTYSDFSNETHLESLRNFVIKKFGKI